jgi:hypothetical protein
MRATHMLWGPQTTGRFNFGWNIINHTSYVVITASEGQEGFEGGTVLLTTASPRRFLGLARFTVDNVSPHDGGVEFHVTIDWPQPITLWTDIFVFDEIPFDLNHV